MGSREWANSSNVGFSSRHQTLSPSILDFLPLDLNPLWLCVCSGMIYDRCGNEFNPGPSPRVSTSGMLVVTTVGGGLFGKSKVSFPDPV